MPAAFNGLFGVKPTVGLLSLSGVLLACPSLDCVSILTADLDLARTVLDAAAGFDADDPWSRRPPPAPPAGVARVMGVVGVPSGALDLSAQHRAAWDAALASYASVVRLVPVDVEPMLEAARMLYESPFVAERLAAFGHLLEPDGPHLDPIVRGIVLGARGLPADALFAARHRLAALKRVVEQSMAGIDAILLPTTPFHPALAEVAAEPVRVNSRLGTYTNMVNLLDLCAVAMPAGSRPDGLPFGVQLLAPAFADGPLINLAAAMSGHPESPPQLSDGHEILAVCGAHLSGEPLNPLLTRSGAALYRRARTAPGYRMVFIDGRLPRPGLLDDGAGPGHGLEVELWDVPPGMVGHLGEAVAPPLRIGTVRLEDGSSVAGFVADAASVNGALDISDGGGWRAHLARTAAGL